MAKSELGEKIKSLLDVISELFGGEDSSFDLPVGVEEFTRVTPEAVRIRFSDEVDCDLLCSVAAEEGYVIKAGTFSPRLMDKGTIVARVGSRSDPGGACNIFIYLLPPVVEQMSTYRKVTAVQVGVLDPETGKMNLEKFYEYNLRLIRLVEKYRKGRYESMTRKLEL